MKLDIVTLFPDWFEWFRSQRHVANALAAGSTLTLINPRDHTPLGGGQVDDSPFGGGAGMVLRVDVIDATLQAHYDCDPVTLRNRRRVIALSPAGRLLDDALVRELAQESALTFLCGRYEGFDERIVEHFASDVISVGRYVLAGGELAAMVCVDAVLRKLPGALGHPGSVLEESYSEALEGLPEYPQYTRPSEFRGWKVPEILLSGNHEEIRRWRLERARERGG
ncbi:MAG TPA: tRNA (guanosine(37)-N1)-methyltransferase TrmD [Solirubrobacteraceae bacterium]|nr:tRNA (guanosine(37)-N1)-methyltransferase TrmD [Solirubrobacteraceae bacterium]